MGAIVRRGMDRSHLAWRAPYSRPSAEKRNKMCIKVHFYANQSNAVAADAPSLSVRLDDVELVSQTRAEFDGLWKSLGVIF